MYTFVGKFIQPFLFLFRFLFALFFLDQMSIYSIICLFWIKSKRREKKKLLREEKGNKNRVTSFIIINEHPKIYVHNFCLYFGFGFSFFFSVQHEKVYECCSTSKRCHYILFDLIPWYCPLTLSRFLPFILSKSIWPTESVSSPQLISFLQFNDWISTFWAFIFKVTKLTTIKSKMKQIAKPQEMDKSIEKWTRTSINRGPMRLYIKRVHI